MTPAEISHFISRQHSPIRQRPSKPLQTARQPAPTHKPLQPVHHAYTLRGLRVRLPPIDKRLHESSISLKSLFVIDSTLPDLASKDARANDSDGRANSAVGRGTVSCIANEAHAAFGPAFELDLRIRLHVEIICLVHASEKTRGFSASVGEEVVHERFLLFLGQPRVVLKLFEGAHD